VNIWRDDKGAGKTVAQYRKMYDQRAALNGFVHITLVPGSQVCFCCFSLGHFKQYNSIKYASKKQIVLKYMLILNYQLQLFSFSVF